MFVTDFLAPWRRHSPSRLVLNRVRFVRDSSTSLHLDHGLFPFSQFPESANSCICIYWDMSKLSIPMLPCMCATFRRSARAVTQHYDEALRPLGLRATQFTILQALSLTGEVSQGELGEILAMDSTTLTRTLEIMGAAAGSRKGTGKIAGNAGCT